MKLTALLTKPRQIVHVDFESDDGYGNVPEPVGPDKPGNAVSSKGTSMADMEHNFHYPVLDLDNTAVTIIDSSTPGHTHLFIDVPCPWGDYVKLLEALAACGIIEEGYASASIDQGQSVVRINADKHGATPFRTAVATGQNRAITEHTIEAA